MAPDFRDTLDLVFKGIIPSARPPKGCDTASALERRYGITLPEDFKLYLTLYALSQDWMDPVSMVFFWRLDRLWSLRDELAHDTSSYTLLAEIATESDQYIVFADFLDWCGYGYAICCSDSPNRGRVALIGSVDIPDGFIARDFAEFLKHVADDSGALHDPALFRNRSLSLRHSGDAGAQ